MAPATRVRARDMPLTASGLDLATKLRTLERAVRSRVDRREALVDILRAVNTTLEPAKISAQIADRAATWIPAPCWAIVSSDLSGDLSVLADQGLQPEMGPAVYKVAGWVMQRGQEFVSADLSRDARVSCDLAGAVVAFPLSCRGRKVGALLGLDRVPSKREAKLSAAVV